MRSGVDSWLSESSRDPTPARPGSVYDTTHEMDRGVLPTGELPALVRDETRPQSRLRPFRITIKALLFVVLAVFLLPPGPQRFPAGHPDSP